MGVCKVLRCSLFGILKILPSHMQVFCFFSKNKYVKFMFATCGSPIYICYKKCCVEWIYNAELHYSRHNARIYSSIKCWALVTQKVLIKKFKRKKKDHELNAIANISAKRFFVENTSLKFRRPPFFIGLEFIFAPEVYRVFIFLSILLCFLNMFRIKGLQLCVFHAFLWFEGFWCQLGTPLMDGPQFI